MSKRAILTFTTDQYGKARMSLPRATKEISIEAARAAMQRIIESNAVLMAGGRPIGIHGAKVVETLRTRLV